MESYWGMQKNSITNWILYGEDIEVALVPCKKPNVIDGEMGSAAISVKQGNKDQTGKTNLLAIHFHSS